MSIFSPTAQKIGSGVMSALRGFGGAVTSAPGKFTDYLGAKRDIPGTPDYNPSQSTFKNTWPGALITLASPALGGAVQNFVDSRKTTSVAGTPVSSTASQSSKTPVSSKSSQIGQAAPISSKTPLPSKSSGAMPYGPTNTAGPVTQTQPAYNPALEQLRSENAAIQSGQSKLASSLSDAYTGKNAAVSASSIPEMTTAAPTPATTRASGPSALDSLRSKVTSLSTPSDTENQLNDELTSLRESASLGISGLEGQGRGIPLSLVRGEQAKLQGQAAIKEQTLLDRIAAESAKRQAALTAAQNEFTNAQAEQTKRDELLKPTTVGNSILRFNPATNTYDTLYSAPQEAVKAPATVQEYEYAKQNGYTGSFIDYQKETAQMSGSGGAFNLSPGQVRYDANGNLIASAPAAPVNIPATAKDKIADSNTLIGQIDQVLGMSKNGSLPGIGMIQGRLPESVLSQEGQQARFALNNILASFAKIRGGTAFSANEQALLESYVPTASDTDGVVLNKLAALRQYLAGSVKSVMDQYGGAQNTQPSAYDTLLQNGQITQQEYNELTGSFPNDLSMSQNGSIKLGSHLAKVNNNPGNLRFAGQAGATQGQGGFAKFPTPEAGYKALLDQISLDASRGHSLSSFISKYAPSSENNTTQYIQQIASAVGVPANTPLRNIDLNVLGRAMARKESSSVIA